jgi:hypothetical protein
MRMLTVYRCQNGDYLLVPEPLLPADAASAGDVSYLGVVQWEHLSPEARRDVKRQLRDQKFARLSREKFYSLDITGESE